VTALVGAVAKNRRPRGFSGQVGHLAGVVTEPIITEEGGLPTTGGDLITCSRALPIELIPCVPGFTHKIVSDALGHSSTAFTMDTYQHVLPSMANQASAAIEAVLSVAKVSAEAPPAT
jgi:hypothetical protein